MLVAQRGHAEGVTHMLSRMSFGVGVSVLAMSAGCQAPADTSRDSIRPAEAPAALAGGAAQRIGWGELTHRPPAFESLGEGPSAVAVAADGATLLLDRLGGRIVRVGQDGTARTFAPVPEDAEDLATGPGGAVVAHSLVRAKAWVFDEQGAPAGEVSVPRSFREIIGIGLGPSRVVELQNAYQETLEIGSPALPLPLPVAMRTKREGAFMLADGRGLQTRVTNGAAELTVVRQASERARASVTASFAVPGAATAARLVGVSGSVACMRVESVTSTPKLGVARRAVCMDVATGDVTLDESLPPRGSYLPRRELAVGEGVLAFIHPSAEGLSIHRWPVDGKEAGR